MFGQIICVIFIILFLICIEDWPFIKQYPPEFRVQHSRTLYNYKKLPGGNTGDSTWVIDDEQIKTSLK